MAVLTLRQEVQSSSVVTPSGLLTFKILRMCFLSRFEDKWKLLTEVGIY